MSHTSVELLSSYLDGELSRRRRLKVERHLEECEDCRHRLEGLHRVVESLEGLGRISPTPYLEQQVLKSAATQVREASLMNRLEGAAERLHIERWVWLPTFGMVIALASIVYLFSWGLQRQNQGLPVILEAPPAASEVAQKSEAKALETGSPVAEGGEASTAQPGREAVGLADAAFESQTTEIDGRFFELHNGLWIERGVDPGEPSTSMDASEAASSKFRDELPNLAKLERLGGPVRLRVGNQLVQLEFDRR